MASNPDPLEAVEHSHSGRLLLRMPKSLHAQLAARSDRDGVSLNHWIVGALSRAVVSENPGADARSHTVPRELRVVLIVNAIVIAVAVAIAIALIVIAWH
jgi:HicB family